MNRIRAALALGLALLLLAAASAAGYPLTIVDDLGREVVVERPPQRIVSMVPSHTETVCALGACELLVGVDEHSNYPDEVEELPNLGSAFAANLEAIVALEPDLVLVDEYSGLAEPLAELGLTVYAGTPQQFEEVFELFESLGAVLDRETEAALIAGEIRGQVRAVEEIVAGGATPTVYYEIDATPYSVGPASFIGTLIAKAGGANIVPEGMGDFPQLDPEFVVAADPEVIVLGDAPYGVDAASLRQRPGWSGIAAVRSGRVGELTANEVDALNRPGPRMGEAVRLLARLFHPDRF